MSVPAGGTWEINRAIEFRFSKPLDFATVSLNTINIQTDRGLPASGVFGFLRTDEDGDGVFETEDPRRLLFQPTCPTKPDLSDAGLLPGGEEYTITIVGRTSGAANTLRSDDGSALGTTQTRRFRTPTSTAPGAAFTDPAAGPPVPVLRSTGSGQRGVSYVELGGDPDRRVYLEFDEAAQAFVTEPPGLALPLNLYSDASTRIAFVLEFNQPLNPARTNIDSSRLQIQYEARAGTWVPLETRVVLEANCTQTGARVRLEPIGILPAGGRVRAVVRAGFQDLVGEASLLPVTNFAVLPTRVASFSSLQPPDENADEFFETFDFAAPSLSSFEGDELFDVPKAVWGGGKLSAAFDFVGTGGPGGDFDWVVRNGEIFVLDTNQAQIVGGPGGVPVTTQTAVGGVVDVRNLTIEEGGEIRIQGPNPIVINATGDVRIEGRLTVDGLNAKDVVGINSANIPQPGGAGTAGGGRGGDGSEVRNNSTPRGGRGQGPFGRVGAGGIGGETAFARGQPNRDWRRPGGGGGGRFAQPADPELDASAGYDGHAMSRGAETGRTPARGGPPGLGPFTDGDPTNDFFGVRAETDPTSGSLLRLVAGELAQPWAGYGGGGGGDSVPAGSFPNPKWKKGSDEKGGSGGGGAGSVRLRALGRIVFGARGRITANGGRGGTGENLGVNHHIAGTGGGGSGGHVLLEAGVKIDFSDSNNPANEVELSEYVQAKGARLRRGRPTTGGAVSYGGAVGAGVIQLHVADPLVRPSSDPSGAIVVPALAELEPDVLRAVNVPAGIPMILTFGPRSKTRSRWISIGGADESPRAAASAMGFTFEGVEKVGAQDGIVQTAGGGVRELAPLIGPANLGPELYLVADDTLAVRGALLGALTEGDAAVSQDIYLRTPALLHEFQVRLADGANPLFNRTFTVAAASYDDAASELHLVLHSALGAPRAFVDAAGGPVSFELVPRFFQISTEGVPEALPESAAVRVRFQATGEDAFGRPDEANVAVDWTGDVERFADLAPGTLQFFRFEVEFDLAVTGLGLTPDTRPVDLHFLRLPFRF